MRSAGKWRANHWSRRAARIVAEPELAEHELCRRDGDHRAGVAGKRRRAPGARCEQRRRGDRERGQAEDSAPQERERPAVGTHEIGRAGLEPEHQRLDDARVLAPAGQEDPRTGSRSPAPERAAARARCRWRAPGRPAPARRSAGARCEAARPGPGRPAPAAERPPAPAGRRPRRARRSARSRPRRRPGRRAAPAGRPPRRPAGLRSAAASSRAPRDQPTRSGAGSFPTSACSHMKSSSPTE